MEDFNLNFTEDIKNLYSTLESHVTKMNSFNLLSYVSYYNSLHNIETYSDYREDRAFFVAETLALLCLKKGYVELTDNEEVNEYTVLPFLDNIQKMTLKYCLLKTHIDRKENTPFEISYDSLAQTLKNESSIIRNRGLTDHHFIFYSEIFKKIESDVIKIIGFDIDESIIIRKSIVKLINSKCQELRDNLKDKAVYMANNLDEQDINLKNLTAHYADESVDLATTIYIILFAKSILTFSDVYTFSSRELATISKVDLNKIEKFLTIFSVEFGEVELDIDIFTPNSILTHKPIIKRNDRYLVPSLPLLLWCVEDEIENRIKELPKLQGKYTTIRHDFLLDKCMTYLKEIMPSCKIIGTNLNYYDGNIKNETDGLIIYDRTLFIIEAKANKITNKAREGSSIRTEKHLKDIIKNSYEQGIRTLKYIKNNNATFKAVKNKKEYITKDMFDDVIIISLSLETVGNLTPMIKVENDLELFSGENFPFLISLYDLVVIKDLFDVPVLFIDYIKKRREFLERKNTSTYEELDMISYYLSNRLDISSLTNNEEVGLDWIYLDTGTDEINDYYMYKFEHKQNYTEKPKIFFQKDFLTLLRGIDKGDFKFRTVVMSLLMDFNMNSIDDLLKNINRCKQMFLIDDQLHDASIFTHSRSGIGFTYMVCNNKRELDEMLKMYCNKKFEQHKASLWIGLGDILGYRNNYNFVSYIIQKK